MLDKSIKICLVANPIAGQGRAAEIARISTKEFKRLGYVADLRFTERIGHGAILARQAVETGYGVVVAIGGDGTIYEVANGIANSAVILGIIPGGTTNVLSVELGLPSSPQEAINLILRGKTRKIDVGLTSTQKHFLLVAGIGFDAAVVRNLDYSLKRRVRNFAFVVSGFKALISYKVPKLSIEIDGKSYKGSFVVIGNSRHYGLIFSITTKAKIDDGLLDICIFHGLKKLSYYKYLIGVLTHTHLMFKDVTYLQTTKVKIKSNRRTYVQADGELAGELPMEFEILPGFLGVITP